MLMNCDLAISVGTRERDAQHSANAAAASEHTPALRHWPRRLFYLVPLAASLAIGGLFALHLGHDPTTVPSPLIGKSVPSFSLPPVQGRILSLSSDDLKGDISLVNVFASWCVACRAEHPLLMRLNANNTVAVHGLDYKDKPADAAKWLDAMGDP